MIDPARKIEYAPSERGGECMSGSIYFRKDRGVWYVQWWDRKAKKARKIYKYKGEYMYSRKTAIKLLSLMQSRVEDGIFRIEEFTGQQPTDVILYLEQWLTDIAPTLKPATLKDYSNSIKNHLIPFFKKHPIQLHEIRHDTLIQLMSSIKRSGKGKLNVMYCLHACLDYAWRSERIPIMPPFPKRKQYKIQEPVIEWLPEARQIAVIEAIEPEHQPIFWWCKYHFRRPGEACALHKVDYKDGMFTIHRTFSNRKLTNSTKTGDIHKVNCHSEFKPIIEQMPKTLSPFFFVNPYGRLPGKPYSLKTMEDIWNRACKKTGEKIRLYAGLKHSSCGQFLNEKGGNYSELQTVTDHKRLESVKRYGEMEIRRRQELMERKVVELPRNWPKRVNN